MATQMLYACTKMYSLKMFIVRDTRKIPEILGAPEPVKFLRLARRPAEFGTPPGSGEVDPASEETRLVSSKKSSGGTLRALLGRDGSHVPALSELEYLSVYDSCISSIDGVGLLESCPLTSLIVGCNPLKSLPSDLSFLTTLKELSCDDCLLVYDDLPPPVSNLTNLETLRLSGNKITAVTTVSLQNLPKLEVLNLDNNLLTSLPSTLPLPSLRVFSARSNLISSSPSPLTFSSCPSLESISLSSNSLPSFPFSAVLSMKSLTRLDLNKNSVAFSSAPGDCLAALGELCDGLATAGRPKLALNLSNNPLSVPLPGSAKAYFGEVDERREQVGDGERCLKLVACCVVGGEKKGRKRKSLGGGRDGKENQ